VSAHQRVRGLYVRTIVRCERLPLRGERGASGDTRALCDFGSFKTVFDLAYNRMRYRSQGLLSTLTCGTRFARLLPAVLILVSGIVGCDMAGPRLDAKPANKEPYLKLRLSERKVYLIDGNTDQPIEGYPVAIGQPRWPTPTGHYQVTEMVENPDFIVFDFNNPNKRDRGHIPPGPNGPLGQRWIAFGEAYGWALGFHGTAKTQFLGQAVSHGCVRMANPDIVKVYDRIKLGTPVIVEQ
jgi:L,D-transpeptidase catalytic domain